MKKSEANFTIYLLTSIFRLLRGHGISVKRYTETKTGIVFKKTFSDSYQGGKEIEFFVPWHNVDYIERYVRSKN